MVQDKVLVGDLWVLQYEVHIEANLGVMKYKGRFYQMALLKFLVLTFFLVESLYRMIYWLFNKERKMVRYKLLRVK